MPELDLNSEYGQTIISVGCVTQAYDKPTVAADW